MMYGYSPFECEFREDGSARVVECSHLRVLGAVRFPPVRNRYALSSQALLHVPRGWHLALMWTHTRVALCGSASRAFVELLTWMLQVDPKQRPGVEQVLDRLEAMGVRCQGRLPKAAEQVV